MQTITLIDKLSATVLSDIHLVFSPSQILKRLPVSKYWSSRVHRVKTKRGKRTYRYIEVWSDTTPDYY
jgi:hypothetical protein